jgi:hypothetical protein
MSLESDGGMIYRQGKTEELGEEPVPAPLCPPQTPTWIGPGANSGFRCEVPATNRLRIALVVQWLVCLPLDPSVASLNPSKVLDF